MMGIWERWSPAALPLPLLAWRSEACPQLSSLSPEAIGARACTRHSHPTGLWEPSEKRK